MSILGIFSISIKAFSLSVAVESFFVCLMCDSMLYSGFVRLLVPLWYSGIRFVIIYLSNSWSTILASRGLRTLPWGVPIVDFMIFLVFWFRIPTVMALCNRSMVLLQDM